jgi:methionyl-tRNA synthetase
VLYHAAEACRLLATALQPVLPVATARVLAWLGYERDAVEADLAWGRLKPGTRVGAFEPLFPRADARTLSADKPAEKKPAASKQADQADKQGAGLVSFDQFRQLVLRTARVLEAEPVPKSKKLIRMIVDLGDERRQIVAGIAGVYSPEELVGRTIVVVKNLQPAKLMGVESRGMLLAATVDGKPVLAGFDRDVPPGCPVS